MHKEMAAAAVVEMEQAQEERREDIRASARRLAKYSQDAEPGITASYWFPDDRQIRLIHLDNNSPATEGNAPVAPFYFGPDRSGDMPYPSAIALIRPEEKERLLLPDTWGTWDQAEAILPENNLRENG